MNSSLSRPKIVARRLAPATGNRHLNIFDPRVVDELRHAVSMLLDARYIIVDQSNPRKNVPIVTDSRIVIPLAIPTAAGVAFSKWHVKEHHADYLLCRSWNGKKEGTKDTKIAKPMGLRQSRVTELLPDGTNLTYSGWDITQQSRQANGDDGTSEVQFITPRYLIADETMNANEFIIAVSLDTFAQDDDGKAVTLFDMNNAGRAYASPE